MRPCPFSHLISGAVSLTLIPGEGSLRPKLLGQGITKRTNVATALYEARNHVACCLFSEASLLFINDDNPSVNGDRLDESFVNPRCCVRRGRQSDKRRTYSRTHCLESVKRFNSPPRMTTKRRTMMACLLPAPYLSLGGGRTRACIRRGP